MIKLILSQNQINGVNQISGMMNQTIEQFFQIIYHRWRNQNILL